MIFPADDVFGTTDYALLSKNSMYQQAFRFPNIWIIFHRWCPSVTVQEFLVAPIVFEGCCRAHVKICASINSAHFTRACFFLDEGDFTRLRREGGGEKESGQGRRSFGDEPFSRYPNVIVLILIHFHIVLFAFH